VQFDFVIFLDKINLENFSKKKIYKIIYKIYIYIYIYFILRPVGRVYYYTRGQMAACINVHAANWPRVLKYTRPTVQLVPH